MFSTSKTFSTNTTAAADSALPLDVHVQPKAAQPNAAATAWQQNDSKGLDGSTNLGFTDSKPVVDPSQLVFDQIDNASQMLEEAIATKEDEIELTVVIPVYNEPVTVLQIIRAVQALPITKQIVVVNDGSHDGTSQSLAQVRSWDCVEVYEHEVNRGKGAALQTGFEKARGRFVIVQDADLEYNPEDILKVIEPLQRGECQAVFGSRYLEHARQDPSRLHRFGNWALTTMSNLLTGQRLTDMETCYKAFTRELLQSIPIEQARFGFEPEITAKLARRGVKIREVGVRYSCRSHREGKKIGVRDLFAAIYCIIRYGLSK